MSYGMTPYEFVQQVYYAQEKVILDFHPDDDKYKEVLMEANLVLQELQNAEDWSWLRENLILGPCHQPGIEIPEWELPEWVYKLSTLHGDAVHLCHIHHGHIVQHGRIDVPIASQGSIHRKQEDLIHNYAINVTNHDLHAVMIGNTLTFNRPLTPHESHMVATVDVQRRIEPLHICSDNCERDEENNCKHIEKRIFTEIPDPNYVVIQTAMRHAEGSPMAQGRIASLQDQAQKILSAMRSNDNSYTTPDIIEWDTPSFINVI